MMLALPRGFATAILLEKKTVTRSLSLLKQAGRRRASSPRPQLASTQLHLSHRRRRRFPFSLPPLSRSHARHATHLLPNLRRDERFPHLREEIESALAPRLVHPRTFSFASSLEGTRRRATQPYSMSWPRRARMTSARGPRLSGFCSQTGLTPKPRVRVLSGT